MNNESTIAGTALFTTMAIYPDAMLGAFCGALFYLMLPSAFGQIKTVIYTALSGFFGYGMGLAVPDEFKLVAAFAGGSLGIILLIGMAKAIQSDKWDEVITKLLEIFRGIK